MLIFFSFSLLLPVLKSLLTKYNMHIKFLFLLGLILSLATATPHPNDGENYGFPIDCSDAANAAVCPPFARK